MLKIIVPNVALLPVVTYSGWLLFGQIDLLCLVVEQQ